MDLSDGTVYTGIWTDNAKSAVYGRQLTLHARDAKYLLATLTLFVGLAGVYGWRK
jgi:hypothetical protein